MKFYKSEYFASTIIFLAVILFFALFRSSVTFLPYTNGGAYAKYEGFVENAVGESSAEPTSLESSNPLTQEMTPELNKIMEKVYKESQGGNLSASSATIPSSTSLPSSTEGFTADSRDKVTASSELLTGSNYASASDYVIDRFSHVKNTKSDGCVSSGLTNSTGPLCLSDDLVALLKTRGGNAKGDSE
jgi:hypothetical protein